MPTVIILGIKTVKFSEIDEGKKFFHFTREKYISQILKRGLRGDLSVRENAVGGDYDNPAVYFSEGEEGLLKTLDVWIRWEYNRIANRNHLPSGDMVITPIALQKTFERIFEDFKDRRYFQLDLVEGKDRRNSDFSHESEDFKKSKVIKNGGPGHATRWMFGSYTNWDTNELEDWNMMTHVGGRPIEKDRIAMITDERGRSDAISVIQDVYERNKDISKNWNITYVDSFMKYVNVLTKQMEERKCESIGKDTIKEQDRTDEMDELVELINKEANRLDSKLEIDENFEKEEI